MEKLIDKDDNYKSAEKKVKRFLQHLPDGDIKTFYENLEFTPFSLLLKREYRKRFSKSFC